MLVANLKMNVMESMIIFSADTLRLLGKSTWIKMFGG